ncbi:cytochrome P450 [Microbispora hainanensis]|uniref:Cytochrome P450 n=1 Tax=Microbispora hainanensis TaxID=568844 RepID=A0A544YH99_9ACTN|nr:cytochrome P450 [Microbispora hainanensis]TQS16164.1 cytochrome P450 [Microbispora hainanensis]
MTADPPATPERRLTRHADVRAVLADPRFLVPAAPAAQPGSGMAWLRGAVSRFSNGAEHAGRRARVAGLIDALDPVRLRREARERAGAELAGAARVDVMARIARRVPVGVLATALGVPEERREEVAAAVTAMAAAYHLPPAPGAASPGAASPEDAAVAVLADVLGDALGEGLGEGRAPDPGLLAAVAGALVQACDATAGLVGNTLAVVTRLPAALSVRWPVEALLAETLRWDPPVRLTRRVAAEDATAGGVSVPAGAVVVLDLAAANRDPEVFPDPHRFDPARFDRFDADGRGCGGGGGGSRGGSGGHLGFGSGIRPCPGEGAALALAAGVLEAALAHRLADPEIPYEPSPNLRVPACLHLEGADTTKGPR